MADTDGSCLLQTSTAYQTSASDSSNRLLPSVLCGLRGRCTYTDQTPCSSPGADIKISEEDHIIFGLLEGKVSQIGLALKYINSRKAKKRADVDLEALGQI